MKKLFAICIALIFATQLSAQNSSKRYFKSFKDKIFATQKHQSRNTNMMQKAGFTEKLDSTVTEFLDNGKFEIVSYQKPQFDANNVLISIMDYDWNSVDLKFDISKQEFTYDNNGNTTKSTVSNYNDIDNTWELTRKTDYTYNSDGKILNQTSSSWDANSKIWNQNSKVDYEYDVNKNLIKESGSYWNMSTWVYTYKDEYEYDGNNLLIKNYYFYWSESDKEWKENGKSDITNNSNGDIASSIDQDWDVNTNEWINSSKDTYTYDANKNLTEVLSEEWNYDDEIWEITGKYELKFDLKVAIEDVLFPRSPLEEDGFLKINNKLLEFNSQNFDGTNWEISAKLTYYYSPFNTSGINKTNIVSTTVYPNPANDIVNFDLSQNTSVSEILIFDINGKQVANYDVNGNNTSINISQLTSGFYMYKIIGNDFISSGKLVKE